MKQNRINAVLCNFIFEMFRKGKCIDIENIHISGCLGSGDDNEYCLKKHEGSFWNEVNVLNDCSGD